MKRLILGILLIGCHSISFANDSTGDVVNSVTQDSNFSSSNRKVARLYSGSTAGRVNIPSGYDTIIVNGDTHYVGAGYTSNIHESKNL
ncbi:hypothetical protein A1QO_04125 [Vibrio genomosp. F10 str. ZF-129]|uniref:Uncharacterized protein n=1 Tax=Vibrio genomosp. F10 str. ZF-129 TaxID=1187848 RepID=A0A1E5BIM6_9VIBR|nr:hypothetical protein [Vibrio genomosp. F10]OEE37299.1 hypothetical protein A1QO_04125 [Vibrio genomosp. F10 str. ZF-129]